MSAPTPAPGDDRPREGYYPDPSIPGYVRYWNGASWVPGTSRPAPKDGEPLVPPPGLRPAAPAVEETGPHFFDEDPPAAGARPAETGPASGTGRQDPGGAQAGRWEQTAQAAQAAQADQWARAGESDQSDPADQWTRTGQAGPGGQADQWAAVDQADRNGQAGQWATPAQPGTPGQSGVPGQSGGPAQSGVPGQSGGPAQSGVPGQSGGPAQSGVPGQPGVPAQSGVPGQPGVPAQSGGSGLPGTPGTPGLPGQRDRSGGFGGDAGRGGAWAVDPRVPMDSPAGSGGQGAARADGAASVPPAEAGDAPDPGTFVFRRPVARTDDGTMTIRPVPSDPPGPAAEGAQGPVGAPAASGFGAGKAAAQAAAAAQVPVTPQAQQPQAPHPAPAVAAPVPQQSGPAPVTTPVTSGPGGGQASWAQQVHQLAGGGDELTVAPWKPPVEDLFQAAARRQAAARPAGLGKRLAARLIDLAVVGAVTAAAAVPLGIRAVDHVQQKIDAARLSGHQVTVWLIDGTTGTGLGIVLAVLLLAGVLYEVLPTVRWGRTLGKKLCGLEVRDIEAHEPPAFGPALRRWLVFSVPGLLVVGVVGVLWCLFDRPWRQCWHDKAAHTFVAG
ncbi:RDD family protein [Streptomyces sp. CSDS2]|uniref:RDD family protein n=1 Tax=Streptomyces sp. CSDS2 TaxID=3055051 RepID=UPI0025B054F5|nr:RDD family protein [Streptomyces sp. CSDS2]MDN3263337.1 RDD family protein [Streptomyces sp. CSDS2]